MIGLDHHAGQLRIEDPPGLVSAQKRSHLIARCYLLVAAQSPRQVGPE